jgi:hypothetical protein
MSTGTMETYDLVGKKEDISDIITNISPTKTPFASMIGSESVRNTIYQWQEDSLMSVGANAQVEGAAAPTASWQATVLRNNTTQILMATASASGTADVVKKYGRAKELSYQLGLRAAELKRNLEYAFVGQPSTAEVVGNDSTARVVAGYQQQISSGTTNTLGTAGPLTEAYVLAMAQALYTNGAEPTILMVKPADALKVATWQTGGTGAANSRTKFADNDSKAIYNVVDVYYSPFSGEGLKVVLNRFLATSNALIFEPQMWKKAVLRNWFRETLAKVGDSTQVMIVGEFGLIHKNYGASGLIANLT